jgi:hypothetical protein
MKITNATTETSNIYLTTPLLRERFLFFFLGAFLLLVFAIFDYSTNANWVTSVEVLTPMLQQMAHVWDKLYLRYGKPVL